MQLKQRKNIKEIFAIVEIYMTGFQKNEENETFLRELCNSLENNSNLVQKDPNFIMLDREDFTNFHVFCEKLSVQDQQKLQQLLAQYNPNLDTLFSNIQNCDTDKISKIKLRFIYTIIYQVYCYQENQKNKSLQVQPNILKSESSEKTQIQIQQSKGESTDELLSQIDKCLLDSPVQKKTNDENVLKGSGVNHPIETIENIKNPQETNSLLNQTEASEQSAKNVITNEQWGIDEDEFKI